MCGQDSREVTVTETETIIMISVVTMTPMTDSIIEMRPSFLARGAFSFAVFFATTDTQACE